MIKNVLSMILVCLLCFCSKPAHSQVQKINMANLSDPYMENLYNNAINECKDYKRNPRNIEEIDNLQKEDCVVRKFAEFMVNDFMEDNLEETFSVLNQCRYGLEDPNERQQCIHDIVDEDTASIARPCGELFGMSDRGFRCTQWVKDAYWKRIDKKDKKEMPVGDKMFIGMINAVSLSWHFGVLFVIAVVLVRFIGRL